MLDIHQNFHLIVIEFRTSELSIGLTFGQIGDSVHSVHLEKTVSPDYYK